METNDQLNIGRWDSRLQCNLIRTTVHPEIGTVIHWLRDLDCCNMDGAIEIAVERLPSVHRIVAVSGNRPDVLYLLQPDGWQAYLVASFRPDGASFQEAP